MIEVEHGEDGLEKMSETSFLEKAKFIMKHNIIIIINGLFPSDK